MCFDIQSNFNILGKALGKTDVREKQRKKIDCNKLAVGSSSNLLKCYVIIKFDCLIDFNEIFVTLPIFPSILIKPKPGINSVC